VATKGRKAIVLRRANRQLSSGNQQQVDFYLLHPQSDEQQEQWTRLLRRRCLSHAKVFGAPLDEVLERQQRKPPVPKLVEELVLSFESRCVALHCSIHVIGRLDFSIRMHCRTIYRD
jgi:hypothetical protein